MKKEQGAVVDRRGNAIGAISVTVYNAGTSNKPTIYSDNGVTPQANPFQTDSLGRWAFYVANGRYDIEFSGPLVATYKMEDVLVEDAAAADAVSIRGHNVDETALGDNKILVYKTSGNKFVYESKGTPAAHASTHQDGGGDEISVAGLSGVLADPQTPAAHKTSHQDGGTDEISVAGLSGVLADPQTPAAHKTSHQDGGTDEISVAGLSGVLADPQTPAAHKTSHQDGGGDEISVAGLSGVLADKQDANKIQGHTVDEAAVGDNKILVYKTSGDKFVYESKGTPAAHAATHQYAGGDEINVAGLGGVLVDAQNADHIQGHIVDETAKANDRILVYKTSGDKFVYESKGTPAAHASTHQDGGGDEISVAGLSGVLADKQDANKIQGHAVDEAAIGDDKILVYKMSGDKFTYESKGTPSAHASSHQDGGGDEISVAGLSGVLADPQTPAAHKTSHQDGGGDEISVAGLSGVLADKQDANKIQGHAVDETAIGDDKILVYKTSGDKFTYESKGTPSAHASTHQDGGADEISVAGLSGVLADKQDANKIQGHAVDEAAVGDNKILVYKTSGDKFVYESKGAPAAHAATHQSGGGDEISVEGLSGVLADAQTPATHHTTHESGGGDAIKLDDLASPDDNTDLNVSTTKHGLCPKLPNDTSKFLRGDGTYAVPTESAKYAMFIFTYPDAAVVGTNKAPSLIVPYSCTIIKAYAYARTAPSGAALIFDINKNGTTIWTTQGNRLQIAANQNSGTQTSFDVTSLAEGDRLDWDIDQIGSSTPGSDITVEVKVQLS
jgi:hypothetical protein